MSPTPAPAKALAEPNKRHIIQRGRFKQWVVTRKDNDHADSVHETMQDAIDMARKHLEADGGGQVSVHNNLGHQIQTIEVEAVAPPQEAIKQAGPFKGRRNERHVVIRQGRWILTGRNSDLTDSVHNTDDDAFARGMKLVLEDEDGVLVVHDASGDIKHTVIVESATL